MKLLYNQDGFIFRDEHKKLLKEINLSTYQFVKIMEDGFGAENFSLSIYEANQIIKWFEKNGYCLEEPKSWITIFANNDEEIELSLRALHRTATPFKFRKVEWFDKESGYGKFEVTDNVKERLSLWFKCKPTDSNSEQ